jgi:hypothetical protein
MDRTILAEAVEAFLQHWNTNRRVQVDQGCQMVCFQTKNPNLGKIWRILQGKILAYFMTIWSNLRPLEIFYGHLVYFVVIWYIFTRFGILSQEKSGNLEVYSFFCYCQTFPNHSPHEQWH